MSAEQQVAREAVYYLLPGVYRRGHSIICRDTETDKDVIMPVTYEGPFGFSYRQTRPENCVIYQAKDIVWFNGWGQVLAYGALSWKDLRDIATQIAPHELFLISKRRGLDPEQLERLVRLGSLQQVMRCCEAVISSREIRFAADSILASFLRENVVPQLTMWRREVQTGLKKRRLLEEKLPPAELTAAELAAITLQSQEILTSGALWNGIYWRNLSRQNLIDFLSEQTLFKSRLLDSDGDEGVQIEITGPIPKI